MNSISTRRRIAALLLLPFVLVLAGCGKFHAQFDIQDADTIDVSYDLAIDTMYLEGLYSSAEEFCTDMEGEIGVAGEMAPSVEPYEEDGRFGCLVTGVITSENFDSTLSLTEEDGEYHLVITAEEAAAGDVTGGELGLDIDFQMAFTFPGEILEAPGGQIDGNTVTYTDLAEFTANGVDIRADANSFPWIIVIVVVLVLGFLLLLLLAAVAFFVIRSRQKKNSGSGPTGGTPGGYAGAAPAAAPQGQQWGQATPPPPAAPQQGGPQWGQASPPPPAPPQQGGQPPVPPQQGGQQWGQPPQQGGQPPQNPGW
ncbi:hypothetical protein [Brachybacterium sp. YJGR34]|uniref:LppM family (lipo)protein n=1 Tax=Brachybacterium sp. YJGR34 TaxID=2059911 RepID=UPI000E0A9FEC|nr:hypothetical protein [Brachybacterium sp. YJGR34]